MGPGEATIVASYEGLQATRRLRVVPDCHGQWSGGHVVTACAADGLWAEVDGCADFSVGDVYGFALALTQTRDAVTGSVDFAEPGPVEGSVRMSGHLVLEGAYTLTFEDVAMEVTVSDWETLTMDNEMMTGRFTVRFRLSGVSGSLTIRNGLRTVTKTSATPLVGRAGRAGQRTALAAIARRIGRRQALP